MSLLADILVAAPSEAQEICADRERKRWPYVHYRSVDNALLADLVAALGAEADAKALRGEALVIHRETESGPWVFHLPDTLPTLMAKIPDDKIPEIVEGWLRGEELNMGAPAEVVEEVVRELRELSRKAVTVNKPLLLWLSL